MDKIIVKGARENNLKNVNIELPKNKLIVMTGVSGSGKSSLAFDTIYADGLISLIARINASYVAFKICCFLESLDGSTIKVKAASQTWSKYVTPTSHVIMSLGWIT